MWSEADIKLCINIRDKSAAFVWLYTNAAHYHEYVNKFLTILVSISSYVLGVSGLPTLFSNSSADLSYVNITINILIIIVGVIGTVQTKLSFDKKANRERWAASKNSNLHLDVARELKKEPEERAPFTQFYERIRFMEKEFLDRPPKIPDRIIKKYYQTMGSKAISYEDLFGDEMIDLAILDKPQEFSLSKTEEGEANNEEISEAGASPAVKHKPYHHPKRNTQLEKEEVYELERYFT